ncbi:MAG: UvrD-helicase domain-containing protein [Maledivibacter sp.]|jgi:DNA helicase-2/ATP-dependent DNA helicase PcrA|nr:UvrD-helicase domain-containing protein [Maledivibacter sp.]
MLANKHPDYIGEKDYLKDTCGCIDKEGIYLQEEIQTYKNQLEGFRKLSGGGYSNEYEITSHLYEINAKKLGLLKRAKNKPYFGRIDFRQLGKDEFEPFYIGKTSLVRREDDKRLIIDWRAPIAGLYYSGELGEAMYTAPQGLIMGDLELKRQYEIEDRQLVNIFDKGLTPMDEFLQKALWQKKDNRLKDIVTTIQGEQNDIIRADKGDVVIVQGVAGSGKTTIVLHRIAYLMYTYKDILKPENILIIVPNNLFLNYIGDVLPDLGVEEITQSTFEDIAVKLLEGEYTFVDSEDKLLKLLDYDSFSFHQRRNIKFFSSFKGSTLFKEILDNFLEDFINTLVPPIDLKINDYIIYSYTDIKKMFYKDYSYLPVSSRIERIRKYFKQTLNERIDSLKDRINGKYNGLVSEIKKLRSDEKELRKKLIEIYDERDRLLNSIDSNIQPSIAKYFKMWGDIKTEDLYRELLTDYAHLDKYCNGELEEGHINFIIEYSKRIFDGEYFEREDLPPLLYMKNKLMGLSLKKRFSHIVIDEAQDYSPLQMMILKELSSNNSFTIVGDLSQGIHSYRGIDNWNDIINNVFKNRKINYLTIKKCYRSTMEIMNFANEVIRKLNKPDITLAEPVLRAGEKPYIIQKESKEAIINEMAKNIGILQNEGHRSIAIICKTSIHSNEVYKKINKFQVRDVQLIIHKDIEYKGGVVIIPSYLAKGLEFDAVMVYDCSKDIYFNDELHTKLFYVAITRALHKLYIYYREEPSELIKGINENYYNLL